MIDSLLPIWQRSLARTSINPDEDFFDLGGDVVRARRLFAAIAQMCGKELDPVTIYQAPTLTALAALLERSVVPPFPTIVRLRPGTNGLPVFIAHGLGDTILSYQNLVQHLDSSRPIYGVEARGINGIGDPLERVEDMAERYLEDMRKLQPHGPYSLIGGSFGGLVMWEIARRLAADGQTIGLLAMLDSYPHKRFLTVWQKTQVAGTLLKHQATELRRMPPKEAFLHLAERARRKFAARPRGGRSVRFPPPPGVHLSEAAQRVRDADYLAWTQYRPNPYKGTVLFVRAEVNRYFPKQAAAVWAPLAGELTVETVPGDHYGIITTEFKQLAAVLSRYLREASQ